MPRSDPHSSDVSATDAVAQEPSPEEARLRRAVAQVLAGDDDAFEVIHAALARGVKQFFVNRRFPDRRVQELTQETFLRAWRNLGQFTGSGPLAAWVQRIAENLWKNELRRLQTEKRDAEVEPLEATAEEAADLGSVFGEAPPSPQESALAGERRRRLRTALDMLPEGQRRCLALRFGHEMTFREAAQVLEVATGTVQSQVHDGVRRLRTLLETGGEANGDGG